MLPFATRQMHLEDIMLCERRDPNFVCFYLYMEPNKVSIIKKETHRIREQIAGNQRGGRQAKGAKRCKSLGIK